MGHAKHTILEPESFNRYPMAKVQLHKNIMHQLIASGRQMIFVTECNLQAASLLFFKTLFHSNVEEIHAFHCGHFIPLYFSSSHLLQLQQC